MGIYLLKPGELTLKGGNRKVFEGVLKRNLTRVLHTAQARVEMTRGRFFVHCREENCAAVEESLGRLFGIAGWAKTRKCEKNPGDVISACVEEGKALAASGCKTFKIEARRTDKSFPLDSYALRVRGGEAVSREVSELAVNVRNPDGVIDVEIREKAYIYGNARRGLGGLPVGTAGRGLLLLSGGIDSPVAGFMMAGRGMGIDAVYFHAWPYTSAEAREKVIRLAEIVGSYCLGIKLHIANFTGVQMRIKEIAPLSWTTVLLRMAMMDCAERIARKTGCKCLITGESLSQVASQTIENLSCTQSKVEMPVLRPLIGIDKDGIIRRAEKIGTYEISILPYQDCCVLFSPPHPVLRGDAGEAARLYESLKPEDIIEEVLGESEIVKCGFPPEIKINGNL
ncbi:MAG: tRNA 4-thiouridine(8) synthase ThiI [Treponema sp.]|jgi:thiamine biosynthesis protein ThiI|nr:tRNA 4-thiouridine(8) synthase ThiI [Treponema sp.]